MLTSDKNKHREKTSSNENKLYATSVLILSINDEQCSSTEHLALTLKLINITQNQSFIHTL